MRKHLIEILDVGYGLMPVLHDKLLRPRPMGTGIEAGRDVELVLGDYNLKVQAQQRTATANNVKNLSQNSNSRQFRFC